MRKQEKTQLKTQFKYLGVIELAEFLEPNIFKNGIENPYNGHVLYSTIKGFLRSNKALDRKKIIENLYKKSEEMNKEVIQKQVDD